MTKFRDAKIEILRDETLSNHWYHLRKVTFNYTGSDGRAEELTREVYDSGNGATILLFDPKRQSVILVRQFRMPAHVNGHSGWLLETPAGLLDGENATEAIRREAMEETGYDVHDVTFLFRSFTSPGSVTETLDFFFAIIDGENRAGEGGGQAQESEDIEVVEVKLVDAMAMIESGEICDAKTIMLLQWAMLNREKLADS
ncbi:NUDIX domain-containing protein [Rhizobiaceae bacterium n13]|uniref:GDP-mannose pyrophosphatase n=1 Tax=Ferirhizobium litorale TaxID=2927786 RepID=A0AAE3Q8H8_9HYPH|nr:NUDIX domain-containing protein [Fererhizobium litorale]MDI7861055.1 NUDIX domain-containing protein [Fererhizobium litorale]MDI7921202.1 NUDIX domain-containing protein [Fererhizobium litorale]